MCKREVIAEIACANRFGRLKLPDDYRRFDLDLLKSANRLREALTDFTDALFVFEWLLEDIIERDESDRGRC